jgi:EAL domain-containing protein (putative c-di-GMP-specific phosphodiesterase class I)
MKQSTLEALPAAPPEGGSLYVSPPDCDTEVRLRAYLVAAQAEVTELGQFVLRVGLRSGLLRRLAVGLPEVFSATELAEMRCIHSPEGRAPGLSELLHMRPLGRVLAGVRNQWFVELLRGGRFQTHFHPIVNVNDPHEVFGYECLLRGEGDGGELLLPTLLFNVAREIGLHFQLDRVARLTAIRDTVRHQLATHIFINFNPQAIQDPTASLAGTVRAIEDAGLPPDRFVFEVVESEKTEDAGRLVESLQEFRRAGFRVALDDLGAGYNSLNLLMRLRPDFVKLDMGLIRDVDSDPYKANVAGKLLEMSKGLGVGTVVEGVETAGEWQWAKAHGADYAQGFFFAHPAHRPPKVA